MKFLIYGNCSSYRTWMARAANICSGRISAAEGTPLHLFHGKLEHRQYKSRIDGAISFALDLDRDISAADGRPWAWTRQRQELNRHFLSYIHDRREDG